MIIGPISDTDQVENSLVPTAVVTLPTWIGVAELPTGVFHNKFLIRKLDFGFSTKFKSYPESDQTLELTYVVIDTFLSSMPCR